MRSYYFEYDGESLRDKGYVICYFGRPGGIETVTSGADITWNLVSMHNGTRWGFTSSGHSSTLETTFSICKDPCSTGDSIITLEEYRALARWLNRRGFHTLRFLDSEYENYCFDGSFNISPILIGGNIVGAELRLKTDSPFARLADVSFDPFNVGVHLVTQFFDIEGDEECIVFPKIELDGANLSAEHTTVELWSAYDTIIGSKTSVELYAGEKITMEYPVISSDKPEHAIENDFNFSFVHFISRYKANGKTSNAIEVQAGAGQVCVTVSYRPFVKIQV